MSRYEREGTLGGWTFYKVMDHGFKGELEGRPLFGFTRGVVPDGAAAGTPKLDELYESLDRAMVSAVGEKYTGRRGAGGSGVDTAAGWFMRMIGADQLVPAGNDGTRALSAALAGNGATSDAWAVRRIETAIRAAGYTLARGNPES